MSKIASAEAPTVTLKEANALVKIAMRSKRPVFLWGPMGIGKSDLIRQLGLELDNAPVLDLRMALLDPTDVRGIGFYNPDKNAMDWAAPVDLPTQEFASKHKHVILFLDEMNSAPPAVQAAAYQLILDRKVGVYTLPENVILVAAGNRDTDKGVTNRMPAPLANRFVHFEVRPDFQSWLEWALDNGIHSDIVGYLSANKSDLFTFERTAPSHEQRSFATPRSWSFASSFLIDADQYGTAEAVTKQMLTGTIGAGLSHKLDAHRRFSEKLPKAEDIVAGKNPKLVVDEISALWSLITNICYTLKESYDKTAGTAADSAANKKYQAEFEAVLRYLLDHFAPEMIIMAMRTALVQYKIRFSHKLVPSWSEFHQKYGKYLAN